MKSSCPYAGDELWGIKEALSVHSSSLRTDPIMA